MRDREPRKLQLKAATVVTSLVLIAGGGGVTLEGMRDDLEARDQVEQIHPRPDNQSLNNAGAAIAFTETQNTPAFIEVRTAAQRVINQDKAFAQAFDENSLHQKAEREFYSGMGAIMAGLFVMMGSWVYRYTLGGKKTEDTENR